jgi:O-antigen/teichoic acid export membrane protein
MEVFGRLFDLLFPMSAALHSQNQKARLEQILVSLMRWQLVLFAPLFILTLFHGRWLLRFWLGPEFVTAGYTIMLIAVGFQVSSTLTEVPSKYAQGMGHPEYSSRFSVIRLALVSVCIYPFVKWHAAVGVAEANFIASLQGIAFIFYVSSRLLKLDLWRLLRTDVLKLAGLLAGFVLLYAFIGNTIDSYASFFIQAGVGLVLMAAYFCFAVILGVVPVDEAKRVLQREFWKKA